MKQGKNIIWLSYLIVLMVILILTSFNTKPNNNWSDLLENSVKEFIDCKESNPNTIIPCSKYVGLALKEVYKTNDFYLQTEKRYMTNSEIADYLQKNEKWKLLGKAYDQKVLEEAQNIANANRPVMAIYVNSENICHTAIVLPGELKLSGTWGFKVPNSVSFFFNEPENSYVGKPLSYAFRRDMIMQVLIYGRDK